MTLVEAVAVFWPDGPLTVRSLRTEIAKASLTAERIAGKDLVTPADLKDTGITIPTFRTVWTKHSAARGNGRRTRPRMPKKPMKKDEQNGKKRDADLRKINSLEVVHLVRDEGVAGSNPATPTNI
jgi:hypothetical protein